MKGYKNMFKTSQTHSYDCDKTPGFDPRNKTRTRLYDLYEDEGAVHADIHLN